MEKTHLQKDIQVTLLAVPTSLPTVCRPSPAPLGKLCGALIQKVNVSMIFVQAMRQTVQVTVNKGWR